MLVGCVSFDCHPKSPFFSHRRCTLLSRLCLLLPTPLALSPQKATPVPTTTLTLSLLRRPLARSVWSDVPTGLSRSPLPAALALRTSLKFSPKKVGAAARRSAARVRWRKGLERTSTSAVLRAVAAAATPPPILLLSRARLVESPRQGGN
jgi:hypothetical protein